MSMDTSAAAIVVLDPNVNEARQVAQCLRSAGLGAISTARTCDEAIFMLGRKSARLLIVDEHVSDTAERRLLGHMRYNGHVVAPALVRLVSPASPAVLALGRAMATEIIYKPLDDHDVVLRVGAALQRPDLIRQLDDDRDQHKSHLETAQRMQIGLLPTPVQLRALEEECGIGVSALYRSGEEVGGDFWGIWPVGRGKFALAIADFAGHGLSAALNTFRLHALLSEHTLPRGLPRRMTTLLNERLQALLPVGQYATMVYLLVDVRKRRVAWCSAGGPNPLLVSGTCQTELRGRGLPLGVKANATYQSQWITLPQAGILCVFSDGLFESGADSPDVPREAIAGIGSIG